MISLKPPFRHATPADADTLARLVNMAGEGLPLHLWQRMAKEGESPWDVGRARAQRESGGYSYRNAVVRVVGDKVVACLIGYPLEDDPPAVDTSEMPAMFVPLQQLEEMVPGTWYINAIATSVEHRGRGYGAELLDLAEAISSQLGKRRLSLIVADANEGARRLYRRLGFRKVGSRPMVKEQWQHPGTDWVLMAKELETSGDPSCL